jgi:membrane associated rhomboid family serine protease
MRYLLYQTGELIDQLPEEIQQGIETVKADPVLMWILIGVGVLTALIFVVGIIKHAFKAAVFGAVLSVAAWIWYFNIR